MSLIPYAGAGDIVLRHGDALITLDTQSQQLILRDTREDSIDQGQCPYCHRPYQEDHHPYEHSPQREQPRSSRHNDYVNPDYFRLLADRTPVSAQPSRPPTPSRATRAIRSGQSRQVSAADPPTGAEFYGSTPAPQVNDHGIKSSSFLPGYFKQFFVEKRILGKGGRGVVLLVEHVLDGVNCGDFACKRIPVGNDHDWLTKVLVEVQLLQRLHHPNLVAYQHVWLEDAQTTKFGPSVPCVFILQQFCNAGDLHEYVQRSIRSAPNSRERTRSASLASLHSQRSEEGQLALDEIFSFFKDIVSGIDHLHSCGYIHRDLKPSNCLLHRDGNKFTVLVSDFGEVQVATAQRSSTGATGTISYCAPEVLQRETPDGNYGNFTIKSDVFSLGMILHYMCFGTLPYTNADVKEENEDIDLLRAEITSWRGYGIGGAAKKRTDLPDQLGVFLERLLSIDPARRPTTADILHSLGHGIELQDKRVEIVDDGTSSGEDLSYSTATQHDRRGLSPKATRRRDSGLSGSQAIRRFRPRQDSAWKRLGTEDMQAEATHDGPEVIDGPTPVEGQHSGTRSGLRSSGQEGISSSIRKGPLLLLPPPPPSAGHWTNLGRPLVPTTEQIAKITLLMIKAASLVSFACAPHQARPVVTLSLLAIAAFDVVATPSTWTFSALLFIGHFLAMALLWRTDQLCLNTIPMMT